MLLAGRGLVARLGAPVRAIAQMERVPSTGRLAQIGAPVAQWVVVVRSCLIVGILVVVVVERTVVVVVAVERTVAVVVGRIVVVVAVVEQTVVVVVVVERTVAVVVEQTVVVVVGQTVVVVGQTAVVVALQIVVGALVLVQPLSVVVVVCLQRAICCSRHVRTSSFVDRATQTSDPRFRYWPVVSNWSPWRLPPSSVDQWWLLALWWL